MKAIANRIVVAAGARDRGFVRAVARLSCVLQAGAGNGVVIEQKIVVRNIGHDPGRICFLADHVGDDRLTLHVDSGRAAANEFDPLHIGSRNALQDGLEIVGL